MPICSAASVSAANSAGVFARRALSVAPARGSRPRSAPSRRSLAGWDKGPICYAGASCYEMRMNTALGIMNTALGMVSAVLLMITPAVAASLDGSARLNCAIQAVMVCHDQSSCVRGTAATVNMPATLKIDLGERMVTGAATGRTARITSVGRGEGRLLVQGEETGKRGIAWDVVIAEASGVMSGAVLSHEGGFLMFGACSPG